MLYIYFFKAGSSLKLFNKGAGQSKVSTGTGIVNLLQLRNSGNYCYSNAVISSLLTNPHFQHFLHQVDHSSNQLLLELKSLLGISINQVFIKMKFKTVQTLSIVAGRMYQQNKKIGYKQTKFTWNRLCQKSTT